MGEMPVHVPEPGQQQLPLGVHDLRSGGDPDLAVVSHRLDAVAGDDDRGAGPHRPGLGIEEPGSADRQRHGRTVAQPGRLGPFPLDPGLHLGLDQRGRRLLPPLGDDGEETVVAAEEEPGALHPDVERRGGEAGDGVERDLPRLSSGRDPRRGDALDPRLPLGQQRQLVARAAEQCHREQGEVERDAAPGDVEGRRRERLRPLLRRVAPGGGLPGQLEPLVDRVLPVVDTGEMLAHGDARAVAPEPEGEVLAAAAVAHLQGQDLLAVRLGVESHQAAAQAAEVDGISEIASGGGWRGSRSPGLGADQERQREKPHFEHETPLLQSTKPPR